VLQTHKDIQIWVKEQYGFQFGVQAETVDGQNCLPDKDRHWYQPDVILRSLDYPNDIRYIIEVENDPMRRSVVGACVLADCSIEIMQTTPATLIFVVYSEIGKHQIGNFKNKVETIKHRCPHLSIRVATDDEFKQGDFIRSDP
jgi:hypothetical protein